MRRGLPNVLLLTLSLILLACAPVATPAATSGGEATTTQTTLTVFAAASLTDAFQTIGQNFATAHPGVDVVFNFAGSQQLAQQIGQGAPADLFAAANGRQMGVAIESGRVVSGTEQLFVQNRLVVVTPVDNPAAVTTLADLAKPGLQIVLATKEVPVGQYALDFLDKAEAGGTLGAGYRDAVLANVVSYEENVRTVLAKVTLGEADAGIVYRSDVTPAAANQVQRIDIPDNLNTIASYPIAPLNDSPHAALAQQFIDYLLSPEGQQILEDAGFMPLAER
jgi:molybdate transport system substrate-binding protein